MDLLMALRRSGLVAWAISPTTPELLMPAVEILDLELFCSYGTWTTI